MFSGILVGIGAGIGFALSLIGSIALMLFLVYLFTGGGEKRNMKINTFTVVSAIHLTNTAGSYDSENLICWAKVFTCEHAAVDTVKKDIVKTVYDSYSSSDVFDVDVIQMEAAATFEHFDRNEVGFEWSWVSADRCVIWRVMRDTLEVGGDIDEDTVSRYMQHGAGDDCEAHVEG